MLLQFHEVLINSKADECLFNLLIPCELKLGLKNAKNFI